MHIRSRTKLRKLAFTGNPRCLCGKPNTRAHTNKTCPTYLQTKTTEHNNLNSNLATDNSVTEIQSKILGIQPEHSSENHLLTNHRRDVPTAPNRKDSLEKNPPNLIINPLQIASNLVLNHSVRESTPQITNINYGTRIRSHSTSSLNKQDNEQFSPIATSPFHLELHRRIRIPQSSDTTYSQTKRTKINHMDDEYPNKTHPVKPPRLTDRSPCGQNETRNYHEKRISDNNRSGDYRPATIKLPPQTLKSFSGSNTENISDFILKFRRYALLNNINDEQQILFLPLLLEGSALTTYESIPAEHKNNLDDIFASLQQRFNPSSLKILKRSKLATRKMGINEDLEEYIEHILTSARHIGLGQEDTMMCFLQGLRSDVKEHTLLAQPTSLNEALEAARLKAAACETNANPTVAAIRDLQSSFSELAGKLTPPQQYQNNPTQSQATNPQTTQTFPSNDNQQGRNFNNSTDFGNNNSQNQGQSDIQNIYKEINNIKSMFQQRSPREIRTTDGRPVCYNCNQVGHVSRVCWNKYPAQRNTSYTPRQNSNIPRTMSSPNTYPVQRQQQNAPTQNNRNRPFYNNSQQRYTNPRVNVLSYQSDTLVDNERNPLENTTQKTHLNILPKSMFLSGRINNKPISFLVDTGASISCIHPDMYTSVNNTLKSILTDPSHPVIVGVSGSQTPILGTIKLLVSLGTLVTEFPFQVVNIGNYEAILGRDFLDINKAIIDFTNKTILFHNAHILTITVLPQNNLPTKLMEMPIHEPPKGSKSLPTYIQSLKNEETTQESEKNEIIPDLTDLIFENILDHKFDAFVSETKEIIPSSLTQIKVNHHMPSLNSEEATILFTPNQFQLQTKMILIPNSIHYAQKDILILICNPTNKTLTIKKGIKIGCVTTPDQILPEDSNKKHINNALITENSQDTSSELPPFSIDDHPNMSNSERKKLLSLLQSFKHLFNDDITNLPQTDLVQHTINLKDCRPIRCQPYKTNPKTREIIDKELKNLLDNNIIRESSSPWAAPIVMVKKKDGSIRFCTDFRKLNEVTILDSYSMPRVDTILDSLHGVNFYSSIDVASAFHHIPMAPESIPLTAFTTPLGTFEYLRLPFGLANAPAAFQRLIDAVLRGLLHVNCYAFLDDVVIYSNNFETHLKDLEKVLQRISQANLRLKAKKCKFANNKITYLGHLITNKGVLPDPEKISLIKNCVTPKNVKEVRAFLGLAGYYRRFIKDFSHIASPLHDLLKLDNKFRWLDNADSAFHSLKTKLTSAPILAYPDFNEPFTLSCDASGYALGYILGQTIDKKEHAIAYGGRTLSKPERNYATWEKELLAIIVGIKHFRPYLVDNTFSVITDHQSLPWLLKQKEPKSRLARWILFLQGFKFKIIYKKGTAHSNADAVSRTPIAINAIDCDQSYKPNMIRQLQLQDKDLHPLLYYLEKNSLHPTDPKPKQTVIEAPYHFLDEHNVLYHLFHFPNKQSKVQLVVPRDLKADILKCCHDNDTTGGHFGLQKTYDKINNKYYWKNLYTDVKFWVKSCQSCGSRKKPKNIRKGPLVPLEINYPFERINVDILGPLPLTKAGNKYVVIFIDAFTKWAEAFPTLSIEASVIAKMLYQDIICRFGAPRTILSDRGKQFDCALFKEVCSLVNTTPLLTSGYHPQTNGLVERFNSTFLTSISMYVSSHKQDWDVYINGFLFAYRTSLHPSTRDTPFFLNYGREPCMPHDIKLLPPKTSTASIEKYRPELIENIRISQESALHFLQQAAIKMKDNYDIKAAPTKFREGDKVYIFHPPTTKIERQQGKKLQNNYHGPYRLSQQLSPVHFRLSNVQNEPLKKTVHVNRLKPYLDLTDWEPNFPINIEENLQIDEKTNQEPLTPDQTITEGKENNELRKKDKPPNDNKEHHAPDTVHTNNPIKQTNNTPIIPKLDENIYQAEYIIKHRIKNGKMQYLIKWAGYPIKDSTWEPGTSILDPQLLENYTRNSSRLIKSRANAISAFQYFSYILLLSLKLAIATSNKRKPDLGPLFDCSRTNKLGIFAYPEPITCSQSLWAQPITSVANIYQYHPQEINIRITLCSAYKITYQCNENFFGATDKLRLGKTSIKTTNHECLNALKIKKSPYGTLKRVSSNKWTTEDSTHYNCKWLRHQKHTIYHYTISQYPATLQPQDKLLHQAITHSNCVFNQSFNQQYANCIPIENKHDIIIWKIPSKTPDSYRSLGPHKIIRQGRWYLIPGVGVGGSELSKGANNTILLDTGYIISSLRKKELPFKFFRQALRYITSTQSSVQREVLSAHLTQTLYQQSALFATLTSQLCQSQQRIARVDTFLLTMFPDLAGSFIFSKLGFTLQPVGNGFIAHKCIRRKEYTVLWNRTYKNKVYNNIPIILKNKAVAFLTFPQREITNFSKPYNITHKPPIIILKDKDNQLWTLYPNATLLPTNISHNTRLPHIRAPRIHRFNQGLLHYKKTTPQRLSLLEILDDNIDILNTFNDIREPHSGSFLEGFSAFIGETIGSLAKGGSSIITSIGNAINNDLEGTSSIITSTGNAAGTVIKTTGSSIHEILSFTGPASLAISIILIFYLFLQFNKKRQKTKKKLQNKNVLDVCHCHLPSATCLPDFNSHCQHGEITNISNPLEAIQNFNSNSPIPLKIYPTLKTYQTKPPLQKGILSSQYQTPNSNSQ